MAEFDYMVFLAVASMTGVLLAAFVGVIAAALLIGAGVDEPAAPATLVDSEERYQAAA